MEVIVMSDQNPFPEIIEEVKDIIEEDALL